MSHDLSTGGCQCGAIRFRVTRAPRRVSLCHCRMCQKATGGPFQIVAILDRSALTWTRGRLSHFRSSTLAQRGFCSQCGTQMTYEWDGQALGIAIGCFDDPTGFKIDSELSRETRLPCVSQLSHLPGAEMAASEAEAEDYAAMKNFQHPDHDTADWPQQPQEP